MMLIYTTPGKNMDSLLLENGLSVSHGNLSMAVFWFSSIGATLIDEQT